jgi:hypothetical protein
VQEVILVLYRKEDFESYKKIIKLDAKPLTPIFAKEAIENAIKDNNLNAEIIRLPEAEEYRDYYLYH